MERMKYILLDEGQRIHRIIFREKLSGAMVAGHDQLRRFMSGYDVARFNSFDNYELAPRETKGVVIRCIDKEIKVVELKSSKEEVIARAYV